MYQQELKQFVLDNPKLVTMRPAGDGIFVLKYSRRVFYDNLWNDYLEDCRGTIVDKDFNVIARPFTKIYNYGVESKAPVLLGDTLVTAYRKVNGFMIAITWYNDDILISTTGSTANDYIDYAKELIGDDIEKYRAVCREYKGNTFMFECVHRKDPHIVPEVEGMYLLGMRANTWDSSVRCLPALSVLGEKLNTQPVSSVQITMDQLIALSKTVKHEGFVFYTNTGVSAKIKSPYYLTSKWVARNPKTDKLLTAAFKQQIDEEYYPLIHYLRENIVEYTAMDEQTRLAYVHKFLGNQ